jgi:inhibitor of KinA sporulation pathway (predicted exonuclease)
VNSNFKYIEVRDRATCMSVLAIKIDTERQVEREIIYWSGHGGFIMMIDLAGPKIERAWAHWGKNDRTRSEAHKYIEENWDKIQSGDVVDVEFVLGEVKKPKRPHWLERIPKP